MRKRLISILIANVLFLSNVGFTSLAVEKTMELSDTSVVTEEAVESETSEENESQEQNVSDLYFDDVEYVKIQSFTELPDEIINQKLEVGGNLEQVVFPDALEITVVADSGREERIQEQLGKERELMREAEREALEAEEAKKAASEEEDEETEKEEDEEDEDAEGEGSSVIIDGEEVIFFESDSDGVTEQISEDTANEDQYQESYYESYEEPKRSNVTSSESSKATSEENPASEEASPKEETKEAPAATEEQNSSGSEGGEKAESSENAETPSDSGSEGSGAEDSGAAEAEDLISRITSVFKTLVVHAAEDVEEPKEEAEASTEEDSKEEDAENTEESSDDAESKENGESSENSESAPEVSEDGIVDESEDAAPTESIENVSGIEWILDPSRSDGDTFDSRVVDKKFVFVPVLIIPDYYYIEAELPTITVTIVDEVFAFDKTVTVDDVKIRVRADEGVFPEGATLFAQKLQEEDEKKVQDAVEEQMDEVASIVKSYTFDIQIRDAEGKEIEPDNEKGRVFVSFETEEVSNEELTAEIYHIVENSEESKSEDGANSDESVTEEGEPKEETAEASEGDEAVEKAEATEGAKKVADGEEKATFSDEFTIKKLEAEVVDGEEQKALEAETDGFSAYTVVFKRDGVPNYPVDDAIVIKVKDIIAHTIIGDTNGDGNTNEDDVTGVIGSAKLKDDAGNLLDKTEYLYIAKLQNALATYNTETIGNAATGVYVDPSITGAFEYYLIIKRPFAGSKVLTVNYNNGTTTDDYDITIENNNQTDGVTIGNYGYPYALVLDNNGFFDLRIIDSSTAGKHVMYQWQKSADGKTWDNADIDGANCSFYKATKDKADSNNYWYRCCVNGDYSNAVQIITPSSDTRQWTEHYGTSTDRCYVSNGSVAYTIDLANGKFDIVGEFKIGDTTKMYQTSHTDGWKMYCDATTANPADTGASTNLDRLIFSFDEGAASVLHIEADIANLTNNNFAIVAAGKLGTIQKNTALAVQEKGVLESLSVSGIVSEDNLQDIINRGKGDTIPSFLITPVTNQSDTLPKYYLGSGYAPYAGNTEEKLEKTIPGISISWMGLTDAKVKFDFAFAGAETNGILPKVSKIGTANTLSSSSSTSAIKSVKLVGDALANYAYDLGDPDDKVEVKLTFKSSSSNSSISSMLPSISTSSSSASSSGSSTSTSSSTKYTANYYDASLVYKNNDKQVTDSVFAGDSKTELPIILTMELSYDFEEKTDIKVYRYHDGSASELSEGNGSDGTYKIDKSAGKIYVYASKFSTFAVAYKPTTYYKVSFTGTTNSIATQKIKAGEKATRPEDPVKTGYTFIGWYWNPDNPSKGPSSSTDSSSSSSSSSSTSTTTAVSGSLYNFDNAVNSDIVLKAGWTKDSTTTDATKTKSTDDTTASGEVNGARAPKTGDDLPIVWLWVLLLVAGVTTFGVSLRELTHANETPDKPKKRTKFQVYMLIAGVLIKTTVKFIARKIKENRAKVLLTVSAAVVLVSAIVLGTTLFQYRKAESIYKEADVTFVETAEEDEEVDEYVEEIKQLAGEEKNFNWWDCAQVNLKELKEEYPEVVGWIYFENEDISYPVMYSGDNAKYLKTTYTGEKAKAGAIFIDGESTPDFTDPHSLIYGHNMRDLSMFGKLRYYMTTPDYYQDHQYFQIFTEDKVYRYQIFAFEEVADNHDVFWVYGKEPTGYYNMLKEIERDSYCRSGITTNESDHVITLATCTNKDDERLIVSAVRTDEYEYAQ